MEKIETTVMEISVLQMCSTLLLYLVVKNTGQQSTKFIINLQSYLINTFLIKEKSASTC